MNEASEIPEPKIKKAHYENGQFDLQLEHPMVGAMIDSLVDAFRSANGTNYVSMTGTHKGSGEQYEIVIQRKSGLTPAEKAAKLDRENKELSENVRHLNYVMANSKGVAGYQEKDSIATWEEVGLR